jgi:hypothetical protein
MKNNPKQADGMDTIFHVKVAASCSLYDYPHVPLKELRKTMKKKSLDRPAISSVFINIIAHKDQRYDTVGDWYYSDNGHLVINVSRLPNDPDNEKALAVAFHELCEVLICRSKGITQKQVDKFDKDFEKLQKGSTLYNEDAEPGDMSDSPYHIEHGFATAAERMLIAAMGINWNNYNKSVEGVK